MAATDQCPLLVKAKSDIHAYLTAKDKFDLGSSSILYQGSATMTTTDHNEFTVTSRKYCHKLQCYTTTIEARLKCAFDPLTGITHIGGTLQRIGDFAVPVDVNRSFIKNNKIEAYSKKASAGDMQYEMTAPLE